MGNKDELSKLHWGLGSQWMAVLAAMLLVGSIAYAQIPKGFWQARSEQVGSGFVNGYLFGDSARFEYQTSSYDLLNPLRQFGGTYKLYSDSIQFNIEYYGIIEDFTIFFDPRMSADMWELYNGRVVKKSLSPFKKEILNLGLSIMTLSMISLLG